jgi:hypothetical protein
MVCAEAVGVPTATYSTGGICLGIAIYEEALDFGSRKGGSQVDGGRGFPHPTFLIGNSDHSTHCSPRLLIFDSN